MKLPGMTIVVVKRPTWAKSRHERGLHCWHHCFPAISFIILKMTMKSYRINILATYSQHIHWKGLKCLFHIDLLKWSIFSHLVMSNEQWRACCDSIYSQSWWITRLLPAQQHSHCAFIGHETGSISSILCKDFWGYVSDLWENSKCAFKRSMHSDTHHGDVSLFWKNIFWSLTVQF